MSNSASDRPFDFGRVFFPGKKAKAVKIPSVIRFQPLDNHVGNVSQLVQYWDIGDLPEGEHSQTRIVQASDIHDIGKPQKFLMKSETTAQGKFKQYLYSFRGHRFLATHKNEWVEKMAIGHHDFSAEKICEDTFQLKQKKQYQQILNQDPLAYAKELYALEMCDQIEAELACRTMEDEEQGSSRTFMDFTIQADEKDSLTYRIDPWPFSDKHKEIELTFTYWTFELKKEDKERLLDLTDKEQHKLGSVLDSIVKKWWKDSDITEQDTEKSAVGNT